MLCPACEAANDDTAEACFICGRALGALTRGTVIAGRYEVRSRLARGGMGMVYKAHDRMLDETIAIKVLRSELSATPEMAKRFRHEIKLARKVSHRNVCRIYEYGEDEHVRYIAMEFVEGSDLRQLMRERGGSLPPAEALDTAIQAAEGLHAVHEVGVVHRDLKTSNIMRDNRGVVRLMDFGVATLEGFTEGLTTTGQVMGTPEYMSPEQCYGDKLDPRSDVYSLGVVLYEMLTGAVPFHGDTAMATLFKHIQDPVPFDGPSAFGIPAVVAPVLRQSLAKNKADRYASAAAMAAALREAYRSLNARTVHTPSGVHAFGEIPQGSEWPVPAKERRKTTRLEIFVNFVLRREGTLGTVLQEERTIAENVGRNGARVLTTMTFVIGDVVHLHEVGGTFKTRAEVRGSYVGRDRVRRLNLKFLDGPAPDYLVHVDMTP